MTILQLLLPQIFPQLSLRLVHGVAMTLGKTDDLEVCWSISSGPSDLLAKQGEVEVWQVMSICRPIEAGSSQFNLDGLFYLMLPFYMHS